MGLFIYDFLLILGDQLCRIDRKVLCDFDDSVQLRASAVLPFGHIGLAHADGKRHGGRTGMLLVANLFQGVVKQVLASFRVRFC